MEGWKRSRVQGGWGEDGGMARTNIGNGRRDFRKGRFGERDGGRLVEATDEINERINRQESNSDTVPYVVNLSKVSLTTLSLVLMFLAGSPW